MSRILFEDQRPDLPTNPDRADIACFVGLLRLAAPIASGLPSVVQGWLRAQGWLSGPFARDVDQLVDVPVPVESYAGFTAMFDPGDLSSSYGTDYVAAAVRSFFAQGGKRCYVVRMGDPVSPTEGVQAKESILEAILVGADHQSGDPNSWHGVGHLAGLPDVSYLSVPDLPVLSASQPVAIALPQPPAATGPEQFVECAQRVVEQESQVTHPSAAPRLNPADYGGWAQSVANILQYLASGTLRQELHLREIQFVAAFPLPRDADDAGSFQSVSIAALDQDVRDAMLTYMPEAVEPFGGISGTNVSSAFLQLAYPWLKTTGSYALLESLEPPDGALVGILARNALKRGAFTSATKITPAEIFDIWPSLPAQETDVSSVPLSWGDGSPKPLITRLSLFGFTPAGLVLLSDVTAYPGESYRPACVNRLVSVICRAARNLGETLIFEQNGPALWARVQGALKSLLTIAWSLNALDGATVADAFSVRCDASTMTQNDLDNGRLVAEIMFTAAATIELIRVTLALETNRMSPQATSTLPEAV